MKKTISIIAALCMIVSVFASFGCVNASADTTFAALYSSEVYFSKYGITDRYVYVQTDGSHSDQEVYVHYRYRYNYETHGYIWNDSKAEYVTTLSDGTKIWKASMRSDNVPAEYAIKYVANGVETWNNNNGSNFGAEQLGDNCNITINRGSCSYYDGASVSVVLKNLAYEKNVAVRVTYDNWNTYEDVPMNYTATNEDGTERWYANLGKKITDANAFQYCIYYTVNGQTYWANNFGANYNTTTKVAPY